MPPDRLADFVAAVSRVCLAFALVAVFYIVLGQKPNCPVCGSAIDAEQTYTPAQVLGQTNATHAH